MDIERMAEKLFLNAEKCLFCGTCELVCVLAHSGQNLFNLNEIPCESSRINIQGYEFGLHAEFCHSCDHPLCVETCIANALDIANGRVLYEEAKCVACWSCIMACPFGALQADLVKSKVIRCDGCGDWENLVCVTACPTEALVFADPEKFSRHKRKSLCEVTGKIGLDKR